MQKLFYPIFKLPDEYIKDYERQNLPIWVKYWLLGKSARELSTIITGSNFMLTNTIAKTFKKFKVGGNTDQEGEPTPENPQPIKNVVGNIVNKVSNKNLFNEDIILNANGWVKENGEYKGEPGSLRSLFLQYTGNNLPITFKDNTRYTFSYYLKNITANNIYGRFRIYYTDDTYSEGRLINPTEFEKVTITTQTNKTIKNIDFSYSNSGEIALKNIMLTEGTTATDFVPHEEQIAEFTLEEGQRMYKDSTLEDDGIHHKRKQIVLDGTERIIVDNTTGEYNRIVVYNNLGIYGVRDDYNKCNIAKNRLQNEEHGEYLYYMQTDGASYFNVLKTFADTPEKFVEYLTNSYTNGTPVIVEFKLKEEEIVPYTDLQQEQYNAIKKLKTYKDMTIVESTSDELTPILEIQYYKKKGSEESEATNNLNTLQENNFIDFVESIGDIEEQNEIDMEREESKE